MRGLNVMTKVSVYKVESQKKRQKRESLKVYSKCSKLGRLLVLNGSLETGKNKVGLKIGSLKKAGAGYFINYDNS